MSIIIKVVSASVFKTVTAVSRQCHERQRMALQQYHQFNHHTHTQPHRLNECLTECKPVYYRNIPQQKIKHHFRNVYLRDNLKARR